MLGEDKVYRLYSFIMDFFIFLLSFFTADFLGKHFFQHRGISETDILIFVLVILLYLSFMTRFKVRDHRCFADYNTVKDHVKSLAFAFMATFFLIFMLKYTSVSRAFLLLFFTMSAIIILMAQPAFQAFYYSLKKQEEQPGKYVLLVGIDFCTRSVARNLQSEIQEKCKIVGFLTYRRHHKDTFMGHRILGTTQDLDRVIAENVIDMIVVFPKRKYLDEIRNLVKNADLAGGETRRIARYIDGSNFNVRVWNDGRTVEIRPLSVVRKQGNMPTARSQVYLRVNIRNY